MRIYTTRSNWDTKNVDFRDCVIAQTKEGAMLNWLGFNEDEIIDMGEAFPHIDQDGNPCMLTIHQVFGKYDIDKWYPRNLRVEMYYE